ncbi:MAG TPA: hypothetical protein VGJ78_04550 [Vicinamibacterales bacterium]
MRFIVHGSIRNGCLVLMLLGAGAHAGNAQPVPGVIGSYYPTQLVPGQATVLHLALGRNNPVQSIEITPSTGITVSGMTSRDLNQGSVWWEFTVTVAKGAAPGPRTLVAVQQTGRTAPVTLTIPNHVPNISNLKVVSAQTNQPIVDLQFTAADQGGSFSATPLVWFLLSCGPGQPEAGVVRGKFENGTIRVGIPNPRTLAGHAGAPAAGTHCDLQVRATDASGTDSNTSSTSFDFK